MTLKMNPHLREYLVQHIEGTGVPRDEAIRLVDDDSRKPGAEVEAATHAWWDEMMPQMHVTNETYCWDEASESWKLESSWTSDDDPDYRNPWTPDA